MRALPIALSLPFALTAQAPDVSGVVSAALHRGDPAADSYVAAERSADSAYWSRGQRYKLRVAEDGVGYMPLFGPQTYENPMLSFSLPGTEVFELRRLADGFELDRGTIVERWRLEPGFAEQSFVVHVRPPQDVLRIAVRASLPSFGFRGADDRGLRFGDPALGDVIYGTAFAVAAGGGRTSLPTSWSGDAIEIRLPADAVYPLVVDPVLGTVPIASNQPAEDRDPEVAFDAASANWIVVWEQRLSSLDSDIKFRRFRTDGSLIGTGTAEGSGAIADQPSVGDCTGSGMFCVAWREALLHVKARGVTATTGGMGPVATLFQGGLQQRGIGPAVGGSSAHGFLVVYSVESPALPPFTRVSRLTPTVSTTGVTNAFLATGLGCVHTAVGDATGPVPHWVVAWQTTAPLCASSQVHYAVVDPSLTVVHGPTTLQGTLLTGDASPSVASRDAETVIAWDRRSANDSRIFGQILRRDATGYVEVGSPTALTALEPGTSVNESYRGVAIATDGARYCYTYTDLTNSNVFAATFGVVNGNYRFYEGHLPLDVTDFFDVPAIASRGQSGGGPAHYLVAASHQTGAAFQSDIEGWFLDGHQLGPRVVPVRTGCHPTFGAEPQIAFTGDSLLGSTLAVTTSGTLGLPFLLAGLPESASLPMCSGPLIGDCWQGVRLPALAVVFGNQLTLTIPPDPGYVGLRLAVQGIDLSSPACPQSLFGTRFSVTDTLSITVR